MNEPLKHMHLARVAARGQGDRKGQYISNKRFSRKARGSKSTSVGADLSRPAPIYRPSLAVLHLVPTDSSSFPYLKSIDRKGQGSFMV